MKKSSDEIEPGEAVEWTAILPGESGEYLRATSDPGCWEWFNPKTGVARPARQVKGAS
jgi:hypothetical protein